MDFIKTYFTAEKNESLSFVLVGVVTVGFSLYALLKWGDGFYKEQIFLQNAGESLIKLKSLN